ncbi:unnamed protein product [Adineta steineri]|uniref:Protein kinase domain-containing protein n=2 Tax=Adineta steineri TaxID=433720 RepID=A0A813RK38_9BILA|nr:unnamed protein product [Adineta steineri]
MVFEISSVKSGSRFGGLSSSKFFVRNCPHPQRVRHLEGLNGSMICNVNDDLTRNRPKRNKSLNIHKNNLPVIERTRRVERLVPPVDFWHAHGVLPDTDSWKQELASLASASGIAVEKDDQKYSNKPSTADDQKNSLRSGAHYSRQTGRFNEGTSKSRGRTATKRGTGQPEALFNVPENERDMWMLQVLCQILDTSNLEDVQSWLVSASPYEKEQARTMINSALQGLKESERASHQLNEPIDFDSLYLLLIDMDPLSILNNIFDIAMSIKQCVKQVKANENQCKRLADRIDAITSALKSLNNNNLERLELRTALLNFLTYIEQCLEFIKKFNDESTWYIKVFNNQNFKNKFEELNLQLSQTATDLNLSINLKEIFDSKMDESDQRIDLYTIQSKLDEIASMMVQRSEEQFGRYKDIEQHICRRFNSFKHHLEQNINVAAHDSVKVRDEHAFVQIPYYDLMLEKMVGQGGFANVYLGKWLPQDHQVAIKIIRTQHLGDRVKEDFVSEVSTMYRIRYDHILNIFGACMEPENYALIVEYMSLGSLYDVLRQKQFHLTWSDRWSIALQMTKGINHLHTHSKPIIHRDIKSLNVLMRRGDKGFLVKIADFGLAKIRYEISRQSSHNSSVGTLPWKAPELLKMAKHTEASDVYALGIVLWELATECEPYEDSDESTISAFVLRGDRLNIPATIPTLFAELITRSWAHEPSKRLTCQQLLVSMKIGYTALNIVENMKNTAGGVAETDSVAKQCLSPTNSSKIQSNETSNIRTLLPDIPRNAKWMKDGITIVGKNKSDAILKQLDSPHGLYVDENQVIYIVDHGNDRIVEWKSTSKSIQVVAGGNGQGSRNDQLNKPTDVVVDKKTNSLIICDRSNRRLVQWPCRHGAKRGEIILENICCWGLTMDNENFLYISD